MGVISGLMVMCPKKTLKINDAEIMRVSTNTPV